MTSKYLALVAFVLTAQESSARFYTGLDVGLNNSQLSTTFTKDSNGAAPFGDYYTMKNGYNSFTGGIFGGWMYKSGVLAAGVEVGGNFDTLNDEIFTLTPQTDISERFKIKRDGALEAAIRFGVYANSNSLIYIKTGAVWSKLKTKFSGTDKLSTPGTAYQDDLSSSRSLAAFKVGIGYEAFIISCVSVRSEVSHTFGSNQKLHIPNYLPQQYSTELSTIKFRTSQTAFKIGVAYHFG